MIEFESMPKPYDLKGLRKIAKHYGGLSEYIINGAINRIKTISIESAQLKEINAELLEALELAVDFMDEIKGSNPDGKKLLQMKAAIAKAKGTP